MSSPFFNKMNLAERAIADIKKITSNANEFGVSVALTDLDGATAAFNAITTQHYLSVKDGLIVNAKNASIAFSEGALLEVNPAYPVRNSKDEVSMNGHLCNIKNSTGRVQKYIVLQSWPDEAIGLIILILGDYEP